MGEEEMNNWTIIKSSNGSPEIEVYYYNVGDVGVKFEDAPESFMSAVQLEEFIDFCIAYRYHMKKSGELKE